MPSVLAGIAVRAPPPRRLTTFTYTLEDVENAAMDLLAGLGDPTVIEFDPETPVTSLLFLADKDGKTVNCLALETNRCPGLPRPKGSRVVCIHFDNQSKSSWEYYVDTANVTVNDVAPFFIAMHTAKGRFRGMVDPEDPSNGAYIVDVYREILRRLRDRRDVGLLLVDHLGRFIEQRGNDYAMHRGGTDKMFDKNSSPDWNARSKMYEGTTNLAQSVPVPGGFCIGTGYEHKKEGEETTVVKKDGSRVKEVVPEKWLDKIRADWSVIVRCKVLRDENFAPIQWQGYVQTGRSKFFMAGQQADLTHRHIGAFYADRMAAKAAADSSASLSLTPTAGGNHHA